MATKKVQRKSDGDKPIEIDPGRVLNLLPENELFRPVQRLVDALQVKDGNDGEPGEEASDCQGCPRMW